jgi:hypothetical protein
MKEPLKAIRLTEATGGGFDGNMFGIAVSNSVRSQFGTPEELSQAVRNVRVEEFIPLFVIKRTGVSAQSRFCHTSSLPCRKVLQLGWLRARMASIATRNDAPFAGQPAAISRVIA